MRIYNIYLDHIEVSIDDCTDVTLEHKLVALSQDLLNFYFSLPLDRGTTYRTLAYLIDDLVNTLDFKYVDEFYLVGVLRNAFCFLRRFDFPDFQINILNHV